LSIVKAMMASGERKPNATRVMRRILVTSLVAGMVAGADSIDDMALLRHGGMGRVFANA